MIHLFPRLNFLFLGFVFYSSLYAGSKTVTFMPPNDLHLEDRFDAPANVTEEQFNKIIDQAIALYAPIAEKYFSAVLTANHRWENATVNAYASRPTDDQWQVDMFGGLARRQEVTPDGFALVVCHELAHHFGGFPNYGVWWASSEGNSDYYATQVCARKLWQEEVETNATFRADVNAYVKNKCDTSWKKPEEQNLCYRIAAAGQSLGNLLAALGRQALPKPETPDMTQVNATNTAHPAAQCRLDTYLQGALCKKEARLNFITGDGHSEGRGSISAEHEAAANSCFASEGFTIGMRPRCWFKPRL